MGSCLLCNATAKNNPRLRAGGASPGEKEREGKDLSEFTHCPNCFSTDFDDAGYEDEHGEDTGELVCKDCGWEGLPDELVCDETKAE